MIILSGILGGVSGRLVLGAGVTVASLAVAGFVRGAMGAAGNTANQVIWTNATPPEHRGQIFGLRRVLAQGSYPLGILASSLLWSVAPQTTGHGSSTLLIFLGGCEIMLAVLLWRHGQKRR